jgi:hypothetical protein
VPSKIRPGDWDRLFAPNASRRGGPLRALMTMLITLVLIVVVAAGGLYLVRYRAQQTASLIATATAVAPTIQARETQTAAAVANATATRVAQRTATVVAAQPQILGVGTVTNGGNLRSEPRVAPETVLGLVWPGDEIAFLEQRDVDGQVWFRIRVTREAGNRGGQGVPATTEGWASATLLSQPAPAP